MGYPQIGWKAKLKVVSLACVCAVILAEVVVQLYFGNRFAPGAYPPKTAFLELFQANEYFGYQLRPSRTITYYVPHRRREQTVVSNRDGFRSSREFDSHDGRTRILVVGDSFVYGAGVEENERFTNLMEEMEPRWRVDSLGLPGFSLGLMLRALSNVGLKTKPDVAVLCVYTADFRRVRPFYAGVGFKIPRFAIEAGRLVSKPYPEPKPWEQFHLVQLLKHVYWTRTPATYNLNREILDRFTELAATHRFRLLVVFLPGEVESPRDKERRLWLEGYADERGLAFYDLSRAIHSMKRNLVFLEADPHWNPRGHKIDAVELSRFLQGVLSNLK